MGEPSAARGLLLLVFGVWLLTRTFKGGLANRVASRVN
jgi:hypothetical protein